MSIIPRITKVREWAGKLEVTKNGEHQLVDMIDHDDAIQYKEYLLEQLSIIEKLSNNR